MGSSPGAVDLAKSGTGVAFGAGVSERGGTGASVVSGPAMASAVCSAKGGSSNGK